MFFFYWMFSLCQGDHPGRNMGPETKIPWKEHGTTDKDPLWKEHRTGSQTGSNIMQTAPPCGQNDRRE